MEQRRMKLEVGVLSALLIGGMSAQAAVWTWDNAATDNNFTNELNWISESSVHEFPSNQTMVVALDGASTAILSAGETPNMQGIRVAYSSGDVGAVEQTGGVLNNTFGSRESVVGHGGGTGSWTQSGGVAYWNNMTIGAGGGIGSMMLSGGLMEVSRTRNGNSIIIGTENANSVGTFELAGGVLKTAYGMNLGSKAGGSSTFHVNGGAGVMSNGVLNASTSGSWYQDATSRLKATIDSDDGFSLGQIILSGGSNDVPTVTFDYGALLDVSFSGATMGDVTNSWDLITWPTNTVVTDSGLSFDTNVVDLANWSFAITNNALRITYGIGSEPVVVENPPPAGPRTLYWTGAGGDAASTNGANWATDTSGTETGWGPYEEDTIYIGDSSVNAADFVSEVDFYGAEYDNQNRLYIGNGSTGILNFNEGSMILPKVTGSAKSSLIGWGSAAGNGTLNMNGGYLELYATDLGVTAGAQGAINLNGGDLFLDGRINSSAGSTYRSSLWVGTGGTGTVTVAGGILRTLIGVTLGDNGGTGTFCVDGSGASKIAIGEYYTTLDGFWVQHAGSILQVVVDEGGVTPIDIVGYGNENTERVGLDDVVFEAGSVLDVGWAAGVTNYGVFDVMTFDGSYTNEGLAFAPSVDTNVWSFAFVDADGDLTNDTLRVTAYGETDRGTSLPWLAEYGLTGADDELDSDGDGLFTWEEYLAGTNPTNAVSVFKVESLAAAAEGVVISWQSVVGKSYSIVTNTDLVYSSNEGTLVSGITAVSNETSYAAGLSTTPNVFFEVRVDSE